MPTASIFEDITEPFGRNYIRAALARSSTSGNGSINIARQGLREALAELRASGDLVENLLAVFDLALMQAEAQGAAKQALALMERAEIPYDVCKFLHENALPTPRPESTDE